MQLPYLLFLLVHQVVRPFPSLLLQTAREVPTYQEDLAHLSALYLLLILQIQAPYYLSLLSVLGYQVRPIIKYTSPYIIEL